MNIDLIFPPWNTQLDNHLTSRSPRVDLRFCHVLSSSLAGPRHPEDVRHQLARGAQVIHLKQDLSGDGFQVSSAEPYLTTVPPAAALWTVDRRDTSGDTSDFFVLCSTLILSIIYAYLCEICPNKYLWDLHRFASKWTSQGGAEYHGVRTYYTIGSIANASQPPGVQLNAFPWLDAPHLRLGPWKFHPARHFFGWWMWISLFTSGLHIHFHHNAWIGLSISQLWFWSS